MICDRCFFGDRAIGNECPHFFYNVHICALIMIHSDALSSALDAVYDDPGAYVWDCVWRPEDYPILSNSILTIARRHEEPFRGVFFEIDAHRICKFKKLLKPMLEKHKTERVPPTYHIYTMYGGTQIDTPVKFTTLWIWCECHDASVCKEKDLSK